MHTRYQLAPTDARSVGRETRRRDGCRVYVLSNVRELPVRLERVVADGLGGLVARHASSCVATTTITYPRGALS